MAKTIIDLNDSIATWRTKSNEISDKVGDLTTLNTDEDSDLVGAINELEANINGSDSDIADINTAIGVLASLTTTEKGSIVGSINELDRRLVNVYDDSDNLLNT
jgi:seryl-tRNA synthetase